MPFIKRFFGAFSTFFSSVFHKRSIIILSEQKVHHVPISGSLQFAIITLFIGGICWASYSTGSFMAARNMLKEQDATIRSVASSQVDRNFNYLLNAAVTQPSSGRKGSSYPGYHPMLSDPALAVTMVDHNKLFERISFLENKVTQLKTANDSILQTVRAKTGGQITDLEKIIRNTGLDPDVLKRQALRGSRKSASSSKISILNQESAGGPFVPAETLEYYEAQEQQMANQIDELMLLSGIIRSLPLASPVKGGTMHSRFGRRVDPINGRLAFHAGLDITGPVGAKVLSTAEGVVKFAGRSGAYGKMVDIDHGFGIITRYGHMQQLLVTQGQKVSLGDAIGIQGSTGRSTGDHVHYEVRYNNKPVNPKNFLDAPHAVLQN